MFEGDISICADDSCSIEEICSYREFPKDFKGVSLNQQLHNFIIQFYIENSIDNSFQKTINKRMQEIKAIVDSSNLYKFERFGSSLTPWLDKDSDIDINVTPLQNISVLDAIQQIRISLLQNEKDFSEIQVITDCRVPLVKFFDRKLQRKIDFAFGISNIEEINLYNHFS